MWLRKLPENFELVDPGPLTLRIGKIPGFILGKTIQYHMKILLNSFRLNGHTLRLHLAKHNGPSESTARYRSFSRDVITF